MSKSLAIGSDHAGLNLKQHLVGWLREQGYEVQDYGVHSSDSMDYPDIAAEVAQAVAAVSNGRGILVCGSGIGVSIAANKVAGIRAVPCQDPVAARLSRQHNDSNLLTLGERLTTSLVAEAIVSAWLETPFEAGRHTRRIDKITALEQQKQQTTTASEQNNA